LTLAHGFPPKTAFPICRLTTVKSSSDKAQKYLARRNDTGVTDLFTSALLAFAPSAFETAYFPPWECSVASRLAHGASYSDVILAGYGRVD
jgi:hypothetical protein